MKNLRNVFIGLGILGLSLWLLSTPSYNTPELAWTAIAAASLGGIGATGGGVFAILSGIKLITGQ